MSATGTNYKLPQRQLELLKVVIFMHGAEQVLYVLIWQLDTSDSLHGEYHPAPAHTKDWYTTPLHAPEDWATEGVISDPHELLIAMNIDQNSTDAADDIHAMVAEDLNELNLGNDSED